MNKTELVNAVAAKAGLTKVDAKKALDATIEAVVEAVKKGDKVALVGFGTFAKTKRAARQGVNPATGAKIKIAAKEVFKFKASSSIL
jgi:DNA-binding protein HU-beta